MKAKIAKDRAGWAREGVRLSTQVSVGYCQKQGCDCNAVTLHLYDEHHERFAISALTPEVADQVASQLKSAAALMRMRVVH